MRSIAATALQAHDLLEIGTRAPEFSLPAQDGGEVSLTAMLNHGPVLLYFYSSDFAPACTREALAIREIYPRLLQDGLIVAGVSPQSVDSHRRFHARYQLPFLLLSDVDRSVIQMYEARGPMGLIVRRMTYLIDQGLVVRNAVLADFRTSAHTEFMLGARAWLDKTARRRVHAA